MIGKAAKLSNTAKLINRRRRLLIILIQSIRGASSQVIILRLRMKLIIFKSNIDSSVVIGVNKTNNS